MCGIFGNISLQHTNGPNREEMTRAFERMHYRGPDHSGFYSHSNIFMAHHRLSIIDLSAAAHQPFQSACGRYTIVFNGEIYNYRKLIDQFGIKTFTSSDTELLVELYALIKEKMLEHIEGMFAFAVYDQNEHTLFIARDRAGIKPCYYATHSGNFTFASELKSIQPLLKDTLTLNKTAISQFLHLGFIPCPQTIYNQVNKLQPGHFLTWKEGHVNIRKYFDFDIHTNEKKEPIDAYLQHTDTLLNEAVKKQLVADVPVGSFLSGGIDSSLVSCIAARHMDQKLSTFTISFADKPNDEAKYAAEIARHIGSNHYEERITAAHALEQLDEVMGMFDEPFADSSALPTFIVSRLAKKHVKVSLSGDGGDELFLGYGSYHWAQRLSRPYSNLVRHGLKISKPLLGQRYKRALWVMDYPERKRLNAHIFSQEQYLFSEKEVQEVLLTPFRETGAFDVLNQASQNKGAVEQQQWFDLHFYLPDDLLTKVDTTSMRQSLEVRVPLLDEQLVDYALRIPVGEKLKGHVLKYVLKKTLMNYLPERLFDRPKQGFSIPLKTWLKTDLKYLVDQYLSTEKVESTGILDGKTVQKLKTRFFSGEEILYNKIWALLVLQKWLIQNPLPAPAIKNVIP